MSLGLAVTQFKPVFPGLPEEIINRFPGIWINLLLFEEESAPVQIEGNGGGQMIVIFLSMFENVPVGLVNPIVQTVERLNG